MFVADRNSVFAKAFKDDLPSSMPQGSSIDVPPMNHGCSTALWCRTSLDQGNIPVVVSMALTGIMQHFLRNFFKP